MPNYFVTVGGVDKTALIDFSGGGVEIELLLNDRSQASFTYVADANELPTRLAEVQICDPDANYTAVFGGLLLQRSLEPAYDHAGRYKVRCQCVDFFTYLDWSYLDLSYSAPVTLKDVLTDIIAALPASYSLTLDVGQVTGPTLPAFTWTAMRASDGLRQLSDWTAALGSPAEQYVARIAPDKELSMFVPGTTAGPYNLTDGSPHCTNFRWQDNDQVPATTVKLLVGPPGGLRVTQHWVATAAQADFVTDFPATNAAPLGVCTVNGIYFATVSSAGTGGMFEWDQATHTLHDATFSSIIAPISAGDTLDYDYAAAFPATVTATTGATPDVQQLFTDPSITALAPAQAEANGLLAQLTQAAAREATIETFDFGWLPGMGFHADLTGPDVDADFITTAVRFALMPTHATGYTFKKTLTAHETTLYQGNYMDRWRELFGNAGNSTTVVTGGGTGVIVPPPINPGSTMAPFVPPDDSAWSWVNQGSVTRTLTSQRLTLTFPNEGSTGDNWRMRVTSLTQPSTITAAFMIAGINAGNRPQAAIIWRESGSGKLHVVLVRGDMYYSWNYFTSPTAFSGASRGFDNATTFSFFQVIWLRLVYTAGSPGRRQVYCSADGYTWILHGDEAGDQDLVPDQIGFGGCNASATTNDTMSIMLLSWQVT